MCFGSACPDLRLPIPADSQILTPSARPAVVTHTVMLPARRSACKIPSLENRHVWLSTAQSSPGPPNLARIAIMLPNLRNACDGVPVLAYVVFYEYDASSKLGFVYLPGEGERALWALDDSTIYRGPGVAGHWFRATTSWADFVGPLIAKAPHRSH